MIAPQISVPSVASSSSDGRSQGLAVFAVLWAIALLSHQIHYRDAFRSIFDVALTGSALFLLLRPDSVWRLLAVTGFHVLAVIDHLPEVFNHWFFAGLESLSFCLIAATVLLRNQRLEPETVFPPFASVARLNLICLYYISAFHKLNADYFSLDVSCGAVTYTKLRHVLAFLPESQGALLVATYLGVIMELALPTLLITRRWRRLGVAVGLVFHLCLGLMGYPRFSVIAYALLALFLPELHSATKKAARVLEGNARLQAVLSVLRERKGLLLAVILAVGIILPISTGEARTAVSKVGDLFVYAVFLIFLIESAVLIVLALDAFRRSWFAMAPMAGFLPAVRPGLLGTALVLLSGCAPYLGLHTLNTFAMYSNLRTEGGSTNHFLVPAGLQMFSYQRDLVDIIETDIAGLQRVVDRDLMLPYQQLRVEITKEVREGRKGIHVAFRRNGETIETPNAETHPQLGDPVNPIFYKLLNFRGIEKSGRRECTY